MGVHMIKKGLDLPISGAPDQTIHEGPAASHVALLAADYIGLKPTFFVRVGDTVKRGQALFEDKKSPGVVFPSPGAGTISAINRGDKRALLSVVIELSEGERAGAPSEGEIVSFQSYTGNSVEGLTRDAVRALLIESGLWASFRTRPFSKIPKVDSDPGAIFITAMDTRPLAPSTDVVYAGNEEAFDTGLLCIAKLREGHIYLCKAPGSAIIAGPHSGVQVEEFDGVHPAGTAGVHIYMLDPAHREKTVWHLGYQDVIAIGKLFSTGELDVSRVISLAGPSVSKPRLVRTRLGASTDELVAGELVEGENRVVSGSVLSGRTAQGEELGYLGRYHQQVCALHEGREREFLGWLAPGGDKFSTINAFISRLSPGKKFGMTTSTNGSPRAMVPIGMYERVMPMDIMPTFLLRAIVMGDVEQSEKLGCLELDEEDLALCTFVCPGKYEYGPYLRAVLTQIEKEG